MIQSNAFESNASANADESNASASTNTAFALANSSAFEHKPDDNPEWTTPVRIVNKINKIMYKILTIQFLPRSSYFSRHF